MLVETAMFVIPFNTFFSSILKEQNGKYVFKSKFGQMQKQNFTTERKN